MSWIFSVQAQEIDWQHFDPKRASPAEMARVTQFLDENAHRFLGKTQGSPAEVKSLIIQGNKIKTVVYNYGNITRPSTLSGVADLVWNRLGYGFEFSPLVAGEVIEGRDTFKILNDGMWLPGQGGYAPDGTLKWGWLPKPGFAAPSPNADIAAWSHRRDNGGDLTRKPHSWPESFYNAALGRYVWPAFLGNDATAPDEEVYFVADDYTNRKYAYYPFPNDSTKRGLGLDLECRFFQFNNPLAEDIIFLVYRVTNRSPKTINRVYFGMYGDPHVGGANDYNDDRAYFIPPDGPLAEPYPQRARSMVYAWDEDSRGEGGLKPGYFGFKFLESPTNSSNGHDDDDDGIIDESPFNDAGFFIDGVTTPLTYGIADTAKYRKVYGAPRPRWSGDEDGDWNLEKDDVGIDGIPNTGDLGEGNGRPDIGNDANGNLVSEPNFGVRDVHESDQIGLTSFWALPYTNSLPNVPKNDILFWQLLSSDSVDINQTLFNTPADNIFLYGSGPFSLPPGATQRFSIALLMGNDLSDLILNAETAQRVLEANYLFAQPPPKPKVTAVPGNGRVTLYWDNAAENTTDPLTAAKDFEGYKIYRSEDPTFSDVFTITDANGTPFLGRPFEQGGKPAQFDVVNQWVGLHPVEYGGRGVKYNLGTNSGLVHEYVDSSAINGKTYYYAVASYDHGFDSLGTQLPPSESQIAILRDPITGEFTFDDNTAAVTPGPLASGYIKAGVNNNGSALRIRGNSTGTITIKVLDDLSVMDNILYSIEFDSTGSVITYNVHPGVFFKEKFASRDTAFVPLLRKNLIPDSITVRNAAGNVVNPSAYQLDARSGRIRGATPGSLPAGAQFEIAYQYYTVFQSSKMNDEDENPAFDGLRVYAKGAPLGIDSANSGFRTTNNTNLFPKVHKPLALPSAPFKPAPLDFEIRWNKTDRDARGKWLFPGDTVLNNNGRKVVVCPFRIVNVTDTSTFRILVNNALSDSIWKPGREIVFITPPKYAPQSPIPVMVSVTFFPPVDTTVQIVYPPEGAVFGVKSSKPFAKGDLYQFTSKAVKYDEATAKSMLDRIYVVPNPYVAYSSFETPGATSGRRGDNTLQFRNLPPQCTIRIYTMIGELVDTIIKDDQTSIATWNVLSNEGQRLAYGVYIFHVDVPGVGDKIGRFGLIK
jgi:hypothetical protein